MGRHGDVVEHAGEVLELWHGRPYAEFANRPEFIRRFEAEAHLVARLEHPYIVPLSDDWREPDQACLVMRHLPGGTVDQRLATAGPSPWRRC